ncbi:hypothetical protein ACIGO9_29670 [Nocardia asteroides]|uniref:hypothetical protein n=1 Tax=Nocardia asteroides TaxID=1824 RepID=UPI0037CB55FA
MTATIPATTAVVAPVSGWTREWVPQGQRWVLRSTRPPRAGTRTGEVRLSGTRISAAVTRLDDPSTDAETVLATVEQFGDLSTAWAWTQAIVEDPDLLEHPDTDAVAWA